MTEEQIYRAPGRELGAKRAALAPKAEMRAGAAYAHSALALAVMDKSEQRPGA